MNKQRYIFILSVVLSTLSYVSVGYAQVPSATPVRVIIASSTPQPTQSVIETPTPTWTPTSEGPVQLQAKADAGEVNVRSEPDPASQRLGGINTGEFYVVRGRYFNWLQFDFPSSPTGTGWVFDGLIDIVGDTSKIPNIDPYAVPTSEADAAASQTLSVIVQTPGGDETATAQARIVVFSTPEPNVTLDSVLVESVLPTYTPPSEFVSRVTATPFVEQTTALTTLTDITSQRVPPAVPIIVLGFVGFLGVAISVIRRG